MKKSILMFGCLMLMAASFAHAANVAFFVKEIPARTSLSNDSVQVSFRFTAPDVVDFRCVPMIEVRVKNLTDKTLYVDLGKSFVSVNDEAVPFYIPQSTTTGGTVGSGTAVNLGMFSSALSGVTVSGGSSKSTTTTTFAERVMVVPPMMTRTSDPIRFIGEDIPDLAIIMTNAYNQKMAPIPLVTDKECNAICKKNQTVTYEEGELPFEMSAYVTTSFDENFQTVMPFKVAWYIDRVARTGGSYEDFKNGRPKNEGKLLKTFPDWKSWGPYFLLYMPARVAKGNLMR